MIDPEFLTVPELAARWKQSTTQIIEHAEALRIVLYFRFDGLAIELNDRWHRANGDWTERRRLEQLERDIQRHSISSNKRLARAMSGPPINTEQERAALRVQVEADKVEREKLLAKLDERDRMRLTFHYRGHLRAGPETLAKLAQTDETSFPLRAYHPVSPVKVVTHDNGGPILEGRIMALEPMSGGRDFTKDLARSDLVARLTEVKAIENQTRESKHPSHQRGTEKAASAAMKLRAQAAARTYFGEKPFPTIKAVMETPAFIAAVNDGRPGAIPVATKILRSWISEVAPAEVSRGGRPRKKLAKR